MNSVVFGFLLTLIAGLSTGIGSLVAYFIHKPKLSYLAIALGFSGGAMLYVSFVELLPVAISAIGEVRGTLYFFAGIGLIAIIDFLVPEIGNPHHSVSIPSSTPEVTSNEVQQPQISNLDSNPGNGNLAQFQHHGGLLFQFRSRNQDQHRSLEGKQAMPQLWKLSLMTFVTIIIHNFPEGIATFGVALYDIRLGMVICLAISLHNIPEGISVAIPIFYATNSRKKAIFYSSLSGLAEPLGAVIGYLILLPFLSPALLAGLSACVSGIMVYISLDELLPNAYHYGKGHHAIIGLILGMIVMAVSLIFL